MRLLLARPPVPASLREQPARLAPTLRPAALAQQVLPESGQVLAQRKLLLPGQERASELRQAEVFLLVEPLVELLEPQQVPVLPP